MVSAESVNTSQTVSYKSFICKWITAPALGGDIENARGNPAMPEGRWLDQAVIHEKGESLVYVLTENQ